MSEKKTKLTAAQIGVLRELAKDGVYAWKEYIVKPPHISWMVSGKLCGTSVNALSRAGLVNYAPLSNAPDKYSALCKTITDAGRTALAQIDAPDAGREP